MRILPGRKTDVSDAAWLAELLEHGLLRGSFVPPAEIRELRDLTRYRKRLIQTHTSEGQRIEKTLEDAGATAKPDQRQAHLAPAALARHGDSDGGAGCQVPVGGHDEARLEERVGLDAPPGQFLPGCQVSRVRPSKGGILASTTSFWQMHHRRCRHVVRTGLLLSSAPAMSATCGGHTLVAGRAPREASDPCALRLIDLYLSGVDLASHLMSQLTDAAKADRDRQSLHAHLLDGFLLAAGLNQVWEDWLGADPMATVKVAAVLRNTLPGGHPLAAVLDRFGDCAYLVRGLVRHRSLVGQRILAGVADDLADLVITSGRSTSAPTLEALTGQVRDSVRRLGPGPRHARLRSPSCFRSFDLRPEDMTELARRFGSSRPDVDRPVVVIGARTSGSYLAPLCGAALRALGYRDVRAVTVRPRQRGRVLSGACVGDLVDRRGWAIVVDDPPASGATYAYVAEKLVRAAVPLSSVILLVPLFGEAAVPPALNRYEKVVLPWSEWSVQSLLPSGASAERGGPRSHVRVRWSPGGPFVAGAAERCIEGVGLGYFGRQAFAVADRLEGTIPAVHGEVAGLMVRDWLPEDLRIDADGGPSDDALAASIVGYVQHRQHRLGVDHDVSAELRGRGAAWQECGTLLGRLAFGRWTPYVRLPLLALSKRVLAVQHPSVIDGAMGLGHWFRAGPGPGAGAAKVDFAGTSFSNRDLASYDAVMDLAGAAVSCASAGRPTVADQIRRRYQELGKLVDAERWLLYRLLHHDRARYELRARVGSSPTDPMLCLEVLGHELGMARCLQEYLGERLLAGVEAPRTGALCAIDVDGVLETNRDGFPGSSPRGVLALRTLVLHGYRPIVVTGRSLTEVVDRCRYYHLCAGVAEYGAAIYDAVRQEVRVLLGEEEQEEMARLASVLVAEPGLFVDPSYRLSIRVSRIGARGGLLPADPGVLHTVLSRCGLAGRVRTVTGLHQTDVVHCTTDKGSGVRAAADILGGSIPGRPPLALAVGDTLSDVPLFSEARLATAPANASPDIPGWVLRLRQPAQDGLAAAVAALIGHSPGRCERCRPAPLPHGARALQAALDASAGGRARKAAQAGVLGLRLASWAVSVAEGPQG